jgi:hypothetical protein
MEGVASWASAPEGIDLPPLAAIRQFCNAQNSRGEQGEIHTAKRHFLKVLMALND